MLAQIRRNDDENAAFPLGPSLREDGTGFDGLSEPDFIRQDGAFGKRGVEREKGCVDLLFDPLLCSDSASSSLDHRATVFFGIASTAYGSDHLHLIGTIEGA